MNFDDFDCIAKHCPFDDDEIRALRYNDRQVWNKYKTKFNWIDNFMLHYDWSLPPFHLQHGAVYILKAMVILEGEKQSINRQTIKDVFLHNFNPVEWPKSATTFLQYCRKLSDLGLIKMTKNGAFYKYEVLIGKIAK